MLLAYCRVSTDDKGQTIENQAYQIASRGYAVSMLFIDVGISGTKAPYEREGMKRLLALAKAGDTILLSAQDRLSRNVDHTRAVIKELNLRGVKVITMREGEREALTPNGLISITMVAGFAEYERGIICERVRNGMARAKAEGKQLGRPKNTIHQERIQELYANGFTPTQIAKELGVSRPTIYKALK